MKLNALSHLSFLILFLASQDYSEKIYALPTEDFAKPGFENTLLFRHGGRVSLMTCTSFC